MKLQAQNWKTAFFHIETINFYQLSRANHSFSHTWTHLNTFRKGNGEYFHFTGRTRMSESWKHFRSEGFCHPQRAVVIGKPRASALWNRGMLKDTLSPKFGWSIPQNACALEHGERRLLWCLKRKVCVRNR